MNKLRVKIPDYKNAVWTRFRGWLDKRTFKSHKLREVLTGCISTIIICEVACYRMLQGIVRFGNLPTYLPDMMIVVMALLEAMASPFVSWFGYWRRRTIMVVMIPVLTLSAISWLFMPNIQDHDESDLCHSSLSETPEKMSRSTSMRLGFVLASAVLFLLARIAIWCHGFAYIEEHAPERISVHLGVLVFVRAISLALDYHMIGVAVRTSQIIGFIINFSVQILQMLYFMPNRTAPGHEMLKQRADDRNFFVSIARVLANPLALTQMISLGLLTAAVWGYGYHNTDIMKAKYLFHQKSDAMIFFTEAFQYYGILMAVLYVGLKWSVPLQEQFCKLEAMKQSLRMSVLVGILLVALAVTVPCNHGKVAGLGDRVSSNPICSAACGCTAGWMGFSPVCVVEEMTTYLSPCQAGCTAIEDQGGLMVYKNCSCAPSSYALPDACSRFECRSALGLHRILYVMLLTFGVIAFQSHGVVLLKTADPRDKSVGLGLAGAFISITTFVLGHLAFNGINGATCIWFESNRCHMNSLKLSFLVGVVSAGLAFTSSAICLVTVICLVKAKNKEQVTRL